MDKYFKKFPNTISDYQFKVDNIIGVIKEGSYVSINFIIQLKDDTQIDSFKNKHTSCLVEYNEYNKQIQIDCINIPIQKFVMSFNELIKNVTNHFTLINETNMLLYLFDDTNRHYYKTTYGEIKRFQIM